jgi:hypothetical protein
MGGAKKTTAKTEKKESKPKKATAARKPRKPKPAAPKPLAVKEVHQPSSDTTTGLAMSVTVDGGVVLAIYREPYARARLAPRRRSSSSSRRARS